MDRLRNLPLRKKMIWIILAASGAAFLITGVAVVVYETTSFRPNQVANLEAHVELLRPSLNAALLFDGRGEAAEDLENLGARPEIHAACVYDDRGQIFASYSGDEIGNTTFPAAPPEEKTRFGGGYLTFSEALTNDGETIGHILVRCHLRPLYARLPQYGLMVLAVFFALLAVSFILRGTLERQVSAPILRLARAAREVRDREDYSVRVERSGDDEVGELTEAFNQMLATIESHNAALRQAYRDQESLQEQLVQAQKMESIGRLAGGVAHDFNNYLTVVVGSTELTLKQLSPDSPLRRFLENIRKATERATNLVRQLLAFARQQIIEPEVIDPSRLVLDTEKMLRTLVGEDVELAVIPHGEVWSIRVDPNQMTQVLMNLAINASDAMPEGGKLTIETRNVVLDEDDVRDEPELDAGEYVALRVSDTGVGMTEEAQRHLFEPFFTTKDQGKGTGLGLATCYGIVKQSGGHIRSCSELGKGSVFEIFMRRSHEVAADRSFVGIRLGLPSGTETILVVEDDALVRQTAVTLLRAQGYTVIEAAGGADALRMVELTDGEIDLVVTDVVMPQMGGREVARKLLERRPSLKVLYVSGYADVIVDHGRELEEGIEFLQKPYTSEALMRRVRAVLDA